MLDRSNPYFRQVELVVRVLPLVASERCFALKGGTAINLFICDFPRLSVDIDLTYLPLDARDDALAAIEGGLGRIADQFGCSHPALTAPRCVTSTLQMLELNPNAVARQGGSAPVYGHALGYATYERHRPEQTLLYQLIEKHYPALIEQLDTQGKNLPPHVHQEFEAYLKCGRLEHGFLRVRCDNCQLERLVAFSCKKRGFFPSCGARRMAETAALLADEVFPDVPLRQWVISFPFPLRYLFAAHPQAMGKVLGIVYRAISTHLSHKAGLTRKEGATGAVALIQRFGSALNLNIHFHILFLDGAVRLS